MSEAASLPPVPPPAATASPSSSGYEFGEKDNRVIADLASYARSVGTVAILLGIISLVVAFLTFNVCVFIQTLLYLCIGTWVRKAANSFQRIVDTRENDIPHLMTALGQLKNVFALIYYVVLIGIVLFLIALTIILIVGLRGYYATANAE